MTDRPILFSAPMIRALLAVTKTQTRRIVKPVGNDDGFVLQDYGDGWWPYRSDDGESPFKGQEAISHTCPYGAPGDRLWCRETWAPHDARTMEKREREYIYYRADHPEQMDGDGRWRPPIHMPRWASRITLEVVSVRVERLQDISEADAIAEGVAADAGCREDDDTDAFWRIGKVRGDSFPIARYAALWEQINGAGSWAANPWVWVLTFRRVP